MLSYRHGFHAGNHADVLKHCVFVHVLQHLLKKDKAFWCIDTHAGAAVYDLRGEFARKSGEAQTGILRLVDEVMLPAGVQAYVDVVNSFNRNVASGLRWYPGSPGIADRLLRKQDRLRLFELHTTEVDLLERHFARAAPRVLAMPGDGFEAMLPLLPPPPRRGVVLMDPSYEDKNDYGHAIAALRGALERFATGTYVVWYPQVKRREAEEFAERLKRLHPTDWVQASLTVKAPPPDGFGLYGSGIHVIHPPYTLPGMLKEALPQLVKLLGQDKSARFTLESKLE